MAPERVSTLSEELRKMDPDAWLNPVVKLYRIDQCVESSLQVKMSSPQPAWTVSVKQEPEDLQDTNFLHLPVCKEEEQERSPSLVQEQGEELLQRLQDGSTQTLLAVKSEDVLQHLPVYKEEEPEPPQLKEEQEELLKRPQEADGSVTTSLVGETEPVAGTSAEHTETQADVEEDRGDRLLSSHCSESYITEDSDEWEETGEGRSPLNKLKSHATHDVEGQRLSLRNKQSQDLKSSKQTDSSHTVKKNFSCTVCGSMFYLRINLKKPAITVEKNFSCTVCGSMFNLRINLKKPAMIHAVAGKICSEKGVTNHLSTAMHKKVSLKCSVIFYKKGPPDAPPGQKTALLSP